MLTGFALQLIAVGLLLWFVGQLYQLLIASDAKHPALATTMLAAFVATIAVVLSGAVPSIAIIWSGTPGPGPRIAGFAYAIMTISTYAATSTVVAVSILAATVIIWRTNVLPRWLCILGAIEVALNVVELIGLSSQHGVLAGGFALGVGPFVYIVWFAAASICMATRHTRNQPHAERPAAAHALPCGQPDMPRSERGHADVGAVHPAPLIDRLHPFSPPGGRLRLLRVVASIAND